MHNREGACEGITGARGAITAGFKYVCQVATCFAATACGSPAGFDAPTLMLLTHTGAWPDGQHAAA